MPDEHDIEIDDDDAVLVGDAVVTQAPVPAVATEQDLDAQGLDGLYGEDEEIEDLGDDLAVEPPPAAPAAAADPRVAELAATVERLKRAELDREARRVRNKVKAATGGAGFASVIPIILQLTGALDVDPEIASAVVAGVAVLGAFLAGWVTPERQSAIAAEALQGK